MKVRSVTNGNIIDLPEDHGLVVAGIYVPVDEPEDEPAVEFTASPKLDEALEEEPAAAEGADEDTSVEPLTTDDVPTPPKRRTRKRKK